MAETLKTVTLETLINQDASDLDFGVVGLDAPGTVTAYNQFEQKLAGLSLQEVAGRDFFVEVAPCTNNFLVRERYIQAWEAGTELDACIDYVFSYRMKPTPVTLRLLVRGQRGWLLVQLRSAG